MKKIKILSIVLLVLLIALLAFFYIPGNVEPPTEVGVKLPPIPESAVKVELYFLETAHGNTLEAFTMAQGSPFKNFKMVHGAILVKHGEDCFLFDTGLGKNIDSQFSEDMPFWLKPLMAYEKGEAVVEQLEKNQNLPKPKRIFLSHAHWDHASGVIDFPDLEIWISSLEYPFIKSGTPPAIFPSQVSSPDIKWKEFALNDISYAGFSKSYDIYGDGTAVLVDLYGHSPGSVGLFVNANDGVRRFFVSDAVWNVNSIKKLRTKFWLSSMIVDDDRDKTSLVIAKLYALVEANPELKIIPAHDLSTWK